MEEDISSIKMIASQTKGIQLINFTMGMLMVHIVR